MRSSQRERGACQQQELLSVNGNEDQPTSLSLPPFSSLPTRTPLPRFPRGQAESAGSLYLWACSGKAQGATAARGVAHRRTVSLPVADGTSCDCQKESPRPRENSVGADPKTFQKPATEFRLSPLSPAWFCGVPVPSSRHRSHDSARTQLPTPGQRC